MDIGTHIEALRTEGERMAEAVAAASPGDPVPPCPEWTVRDLVHHMGGVHRWATGYVAEARTDQRDVDLIDVVGAWPDDRDLVPWLRAGDAALADALEAAPDDLDCWTFLRAPSPKAMWARRQAHETAVHRVDAELAGRGADAGSISRFDPAFAADGVDELLSCFLPRPRSRLRSDPPTTLGVACADDDAGWLLHIGPDGVATTSGTAEVAADAACTVRAPAADLYLVLWSRRSPGVLEVSGDERVLRLFLEKVNIRWA